MYDFIVVGAGSAGCVLAEGLSRSHSVLLIEAGGSDRRPEVAIPAAFSKQFDSDIDWAFETEPEDATSNRSMYMPRGRMLGGTSSMNAMIYIRGRPSDYDSWGLERWSWDDVLPVFIAQEANQRGSSEFHGDSGPVRVEDLRSPNPLSRLFLQALEEVGVPPNSDFNGAAQEGAGFYQVTQRRGRRWSAADAFLRPSLNRPTLDVVTRAHVSRVILEQGVAVGVEYIVDGRIATVRCDREVVLAAGAIGSPQILELSGIGDPSRLAKAGVETVISNHSVGEHLKDHVVVGVITEADSKDTLDDAESLWQMLRWIAIRRGKLTSNVAEAGAFVRSDSALNEPDLQFHFGPANFEDHGRTGGVRAVSLGPVLIKPRSEGSVHLRTSDPTTAPAIQPNYLTDPADLRALTVGFDMSREIAASSAFMGVVGVELVPGPGVTTSEEITTAMRERCEGFYHPVGTCRMGENPEDSVVDDQLRVHGVERLRVADASIMPEIISGNTNAPTMMIAGKAVELILGAQSANGSSS